MSVYKNDNDDDDGYQLCIHKYDGSLYVNNCHITQLASFERPLTSIYPNPRSNLNFV